MNTAESAKQNKERVVNVDHSGDHSNVAMVLPIVATTSLIGPPFGDIIAAGIIISAIVLDNFNEIPPLDQLHTSTRLHGRSIEDMIPINLIKQILQVSMLQVF